MIASLIVELLLGLGGVFASRESARDESTSDARRMTSVLARAVVTPNLSDALLHGDHQAIRRRPGGAAQRGLPQHKATGVELLVSLEGDWLVLTVADDGIGFDVDALAAAPAGGHVGLRLLRDLVHAAGGTLDVVSSPGAGTRVRLEVPQR